ARGQKVVSKFSAITVLHRREQVTAVLGAFQRDFRDPRKLPAENVGIRVGRRPDFVEVDLLIERLIFLRPFIAAWIVRVVKAGTVGVQGHAAARRGELHAWYDITKRLASSHIVNVDRTFLAPPFRKRYGHELSIKRRDIKVNRRLSPGID